MSKKKLNDELRAKFPEYVEKWMAIGMSTDNSKFYEIEDDVERLYRTVNLPKPSVIIYLDSPLAADLFLNIINQCGEYDIEDPSKMTTKALRQFVLENNIYVSSHNSLARYGNQDAPWLGFYSFFQNEMDVPKNELLEAYISISEKIGWFYPTEDFFIATKKPCVIHVNDEGDLHCSDNYAVEYEDGTCSYCVMNGVFVPDYLVFNPELITVSDIESESNIELRRIKIDLYGDERYLIDSNAVLIHEDDWGKLYKKDLQNDEPLVMVKVVNSTPEPDGTFKDYFIRVRPDVKTAKEAVASSFRMSADEYNPIIET